MAFDATTMTQLFILLTWMCLTTSPWKTVCTIFTTVLTSQAVIESLVVSSSIVFAPGLFDVIQSATPPTVAWFKTLPTKCKKVWGVYLLVLEKPGCRPRIYIGSGTAAERGVAQRWYQYDNYMDLPVYVELSLKEGYIIVHKGLLFWMPLPSAEDVPKLRVLFVAGEAGMTFVFRAARCKTLFYYGLSHMCPWVGQSLEWDGLCSHNSLSELPASDHDLTAEELAAAASLKHEKILQWAREAAERRYAENPNWHNEWRAQKKAENPEEYRLKANSNRQNFVNNNPEAVKKIERRCVEKAVATKRHHCHICTHSFTKKAKLTKHLTGPKHAARAERFERRLNGTDTTDMSLYCVPCDQSFTRKLSMDEHLAGPRHAERVARLERENS